MLSYNITKNNKLYNLPDTDISHLSNDINRAVGSILDHCLRYITIVQTYFQLNCAGIQLLRMPKLQLDNLYKYSLIANITMFHLNESFI